MSTPPLAAEPPLRPGVLGILGGMGPLATAHFYQRLVDQTAARTDQEHLPVAIWGDPTVPDRSAALLDPSAPDPTPWLRRGARLLELVGVDLIAVPCNSAHPFLARLANDVRVPILDIVTATVDRTAELLGPGGRVAILSTLGTQRTGIYDQLSRAAGLEVIELPPPTRRRAQHAITEIKAGRLDNARLLAGDVERDLLPLCPDAVIAGCTELTTIRDELTARWPVVDSTTELAHLALRRMRADPLERHQQRLRSVHDRPDAPACG